MGLARGLLPGRVSLAEGRPWFLAAWGSLPEERGLDATGMLAAAAQAKLQALLLLGAAPLCEFPDRTMASQGIDGAGFVVAVDCFLTESAKRADVVLPAATYAERPGTFTNLEGRVSRLGQKVTAPGQAWADWMIAAELAFRLGQELGFDGIDAIWDEIESVAPSHRGVTRALLASRWARDGVVVPRSRSEPSVEPGAGRPGGGGDRLEMITDAGAGVTQAPPAPIDPVADPGI